MKLRSGSNYLAPVRYATRALRRSPGYRRFVGPALSGAAAAVTQAAGSYLGSLSGRNSTEARVLSTQHDVVNRYRKKRMPRRRRRRWVGFVRKVRAVELAAQPLQFYGLARTERLTGAVNVQTYAGYMLGGTSVTNNDELYQIFQQAYNTISVSDAAEHIIFMKSISLDIQLTNSATTGAVVDVYKLLCRKSISTATAPAAQFTAALGELASPSGGGTVTTTNASITAFDAPNFCSYWKILNKKEILLGAGQTTTMQLRNAKNKRIDGKVLNTSPQALPGYTMCYLFMIRGAPELNAGLSRLAATDITFGIQYNLKYAIPPGKTAESG